MLDEGMGSYDYVSQVAINHGTIMTLRSGFKVFS